jgi:hypothetical protein
MSRKGCCLCEDAEAIARFVADKGLCRFEVIDVDRELELAARFGADVPVVLIEGVVSMKHRISQAELEERLNLLMKEQRKC